MPLELGVWRIDNGTSEVHAASLDKEQRLEDILSKDISIASPNWMIVGRQVQTGYGGYIDLLAMDRDGNLVVLELKRDLSPREAVAQLLDYAVWVQDLRADEVSGIFQKYQEKYLGNGAESLDAAFCKAFNREKMPETINASHELVLVASALDDSAERIVTYLSESYGVPVNAVFFRVFKDEDREYLTRAWFRDPTGMVEAEDSPVARRWNGEYYASFGNDYDWEQARKYGYIVAGGGEWYSRTLSMLEKGGRVWVNTPANGYVGVGEVADDKPMTADKFLVQNENGTEVSLASLPSVDPAIMADLGSPPKENFLVRVHWLKTVSKSAPIKETGFFGNQNSVCKPTSETWDHTTNRLKKRFGVK